jgi:alcohol dehydrogenase
MSTSFSFTLPTRIEFGDGASAGAGTEAKGLGGTCALLVTDPGVRSAGVVDPVLASLEEAGLDVVVFDHIAPNPRDTSITAGVALAKSERCDVVVAVGGGSAMDTAKCITVIQANGGVIRDYESTPDCWFKVPGPCTPLVTIPTTAGTGSEVTMFAVVTDLETHVKWNVGDPKMAPRVALVDPSLTLSLPPAVTAATGMDALTHAIEAYTVICAEPLSDALALEAIRLIARSLRTAYANGANGEARCDMMLASMLAGLAFSNGDCGAVHGMAESIGGVYDTPHGVANAIYLPVLMEYNVIAVPTKFAVIASAMGENIDGLSPMAAARRAIVAVRELAADLRIPTAHQVGVRDEDLPMLAERAMENLSTPDNPRTMSVADYLELFQIAQRI